MVFSFVSLYDDGTNTFRINFSWRIASLGYPIALSLHCTPQQPLMSSIIRLTAEHPARATCEYSHRFRSATQSWFSTRPAPTAKKPAAADAPTCCPSIQTLLTGCVTDQ